MSVMHLQPPDVLLQPDGLNPGLRLDEVQSDLFGTPCDKDGNPLTAEDVQYLESLAEYQVWAENDTARFMNDDYKFEITCFGNPATDVTSVANMFVRLFLDEEEAVGWVEHYANVSCNFFGDDYFPHGLNRRWVDVMVAPWDARI